MFTKLRVFFQNSGFFFFRTQVFKKKTEFFSSKSSLNNAHAIYLLTTIAGSKKINKLALMINGFICFPFHFVPFKWNKHNAFVHSCDIRELSP